MKCVFLILLGLAAFMVQPSEQKVNWGISGHHEDHQLRPEQAGHDVLLREIRRRKRRRLLAQQLGEARPHVQEAERVLVAALVLQPQSAWRPLLLLPLSLNSLSLDYILWVS
ncbi:hypothetical protein BOX15_Mlig017780g2 [Macrostomum lignano]|uniref:Uncharacterized protein n=1 Tax=Macrostomum lignano TaxID=282301 RepID=A0A267DLU7_9PLAT|nr:hypothetical protein BOX15_Mlig017780g2 [Macrostomum lignano]